MHRRIDVIIIIAAILFLIVLALYIISSCRARHDIDELLHNPTFTGTVVRKGVAAEQRGLIGSVPAKYILHIVGEYFCGDDIIMFDRKFIVPAKMFHGLQVGDVISYGGTRGLLLGEG